MKSSRNMMSAALATASMGSATAMKAMNTADTRMARCGVLRVGWMRLKNEGRLRSRPMAKETREEEKIVALRALMVDSRPANRSMSPPPRKKCRAASTRAVSFFSPRYFQLGMSGTCTAPRAENATRR